MKLRTIVAITVGATVAVGLIIWLIQFAIDWSRPNLWGSGWVDEGKPWNSSETGVPFEGARLIALKRHKMVDDNQFEYTWPVQVLIVFSPETKAEVHGRGKSAGPYFAEPRWRFRLGDRADQTNSISIRVDKEYESITIDDREFSARGGNLFCVFIDSDMQCAKVEQLGETKLTKATIADFKRLLPDERAVQAIRAH